MQQFKQMPIIKRIILILFSLGLLCSIIGIIHIQTNNQALQYESLEELVLNMQHSKAELDAPPEGHAPLVTAIANSTLPNQELLGENNNDVNIADAIAQGHIIDESVSVNEPVVEQENELKININTASAEQLQQLKGIGPSKAAAIVAERQRGGPFKSVADIKRVKGIGEKTFESIKESLVY